MPERRPDWLPVARWELFRIMRRKDFIISILTTPLLVFGVSFMMTAFDRNRPHKVAVARTDASGAVTARGTQALPPHKGFTWLDPGDAGADSAALMTKLRGNAFEAALLIHVGDDGRWTTDLITRREPPRWAREMGDIVRAEARKDRGQRMGLTPAQLSALDDSVQVRTHVAVGTRSGGRMGDFLVTFGILILTVTVLLTSMSYLMVGISGEKQARVTEVVVSAIPAQAWMDGKILAFTAIGLITGLVWAGSTLMMAMMFAFRLPLTINLATMAITMVFALLGLYFYNAMISALMASAQSMQSASKWQGNFLMLPFIPFFFLGVLLDSPDSPLMMVLSQVPTFSPVLIPARLVTGGVQPWEVILALALLIAACWGMRIVAGRIFRLGMLLYGKDMNLPELIRWARVK
ncbi:MAG TPA: ABC transporter permease [Candidatus Eisenbacteria bacterium]|nr:ABC transporter permease [Candidatus Eisenbacteria bacterium]